MNYTPFTPFPTSSPSATLLPLLFSFASPYSRRLLDSLLCELNVQSAPTGRRYDQWDALSARLNSNAKLAVLADNNHRQIILEFMRAECMELYRHSYLNNAHITHKQVRHLQRVGPYTFNEAIRIVSKLRVIHNHYFKQLEEQNSEDHIQMKILRLLRLCRTSKRNVNSNADKLDFLLQEEDDRLIKQLGKMLREAWKKDKSGTPPKTQSMPSIWGCTLQGLDSRSFL